MRGYYRVTQNKLRNKFVELDGKKFRSQAEAGYYSGLKLALAAGVIAGFDCQVPFQVIVNGVKVFKYYADFVIKHNDGKSEIVDVKGYRGGSTYAVFRLKKKCVEAQYGVKITEIVNGKKVTEKKGMKNAKV